MTGFFRSAGPQALPSQTYNYAALNAFAVGPQEESAGNEGHECEANVRDEGPGDSGDVDVDVDVDGDGDGCNDDTSTPQE